MIHSRSRTQGEFVLRLFAVSLLVFATAGAGAKLLIQFGRTPAVPEEVRFPPLFYASSVLLGLCSVALHLAVQGVRREKQRLLRQALATALTLATLFVSVQSYGLWWLSQGQNPTEAETGVRPFVFVIAALHALHVAVALMVLVFVMLRGCEDRYDHEYYWGVLVCAWFWHLLGVIWLAILAVFMIVVR